jgi:uncharacterized metal-binding protein YceD (DUF177 family)
LKQSNTYEIQFSGLSLGTHSFDWNLDQSFFQGFLAEDILDADINAQVNLLKKERIMELTFTSKGKFKSYCDRCGDELWVDISSEEELLVRFSNETDLSGDEVIFLDMAEYKLEISQYLFEFSYLALPVKRVHSEGECNQEVEEFLSESIDEEPLEDESEDSNIDPRWEALKKLK